MPSVPNRLHIDSTIWGTLNFLLEKKMILWEKSLLRKHFIRLNSVFNKELGMHKQKLTVLILSIIGMLCTFMPWVNIPLVGALNGTQRDGWISPVLFSIPVLLCLLRDQSAPFNKLQGYGIASIGALIFFFTLYKIIGFSTGMAQIAQDNPFAEILEQNVSIGFGLYLLLLTGAALPIAVFTLRIKKCAL